jgi:hypothetical protein
LDYLDISGLEFTTGGQQNIITYFSFVQEITAISIIATHAIAAV